RRASWQPITEYGGILRRMPQRIWYGNRESKRDMPLRSSPRFTRIPIISVRLDCSDMTLRFSLMLLVLAMVPTLILGGCAMEPAQPPGAAAVAPVAPTLYRITAGSAGPIGAGEPFSRRRIQELFPGRDVETIALANEDETFYGFVVFDQGLQVMAAEPDKGNRRIVAVHGVGPAVAGPNDEKIGMTFANAHIS